MLGSKYSSNTGNRIFGYDLIKTIAIFMIVIYHLGGIDYGTIVSGEYYLPNVNKFFSAICAAGVPLFFMVNGALVIHKNPHWKQMVLKAVHLLFLLVFWKFVLQYLISNRLLNIKDDMVHFWFLGTLALVYLVSIVLQKYSHLRSFVLILLLIFPFLFNLFWDVFLFIFPAFDGIKITHTGFYTFYAILYFYLGDILRERHFISVCSIGLMVIGLLLVNFEVVAMSNHHRVIYDGVNSSFPSFGALAMSVGFFMFLKDQISSNDLIKKTVIFIGRNTMGIYMFHVLFIFMLRRFCPELFLVINPLASLLISSIIILITAFISHLFSQGKAAFLVNLSIRTYTPLFKF